VVLAELKALIDTYSQITESPYGDYSSSQLSIDNAKVILDALDAWGAAIPKAEKCDGVILKYPDRVHVEICDTGSLFIFDKNHNMFIFDDLQQCIEKVIELVSYDPHHNEADQAEMDRLQLSGLL